jgi:hypothetical protein
MVLNTLCIMLSSIVISFHYLTFGEARFSPGRGADLHCRRIPAAFRYPVFGEMALDNQIPKSIDIEFVAYSDTAQIKPPEDTPSRSTNGLANIYTSIIGPLFVEFYEDYDDWLYSKLGNPDNWPIIWRCGRVIRKTEPPRSVARSVVFACRQRQENLWTARRSDGWRSIHANGRNERRIRQSGVPDLAPVHCPKNLAALVHHQIELGVVPGNHRVVICETIALFEVIIPDKTHRTYAGTGSVRYTW